MLDFLSGPEFLSLGQVIVIDIVMSGDNAIIIGMAAAGLPADIRRRAIVIGILAATVLRIAFASVAIQLLAITGLTLGGGLLLLWVCWRMWRDIRDGRMGGPAKSDAGADAAKPKSLRQALTAIVVADVSMSLDNVLAVAGAARDHIGILVFGLVLSIALMAVASSYIAGLLERHHWIAYIGLAIVGYVAGDMVYNGLAEVAEAATS